MQARSEIEQFMATDVAKISCSLKSEHVLFLTHAGTVYARGKNNQGQLGLGDCEDRTRVAGHIMPSQIPELKNIIDIFTGYDCSFCLDADFKVYAFGGNEVGQLGLGHYQPQSTPQLVTALSNFRIIHIETSRHTTYFLDDQGRVFHTGRLHNGAIYLMPLQILNFPPIVKLFLFTDNIFFLTNDGTVYACGVNNYNELGLNLDGMVLHPHKVDIPPVVDIGRSRNTTFFLCQDGQVYGCGKNHGNHLTMCLKEQIKTNPRSLQFPLLRLNIFDNDPVVKMSTGGQCNIFLTQSNKIYLQFRYVAIGRRAKDEAFDLPEPVTIPVPDNLCQNISPPLFIYVNHRALYMYTAETIEHQRCLALLAQQDNSWLARNRLLAAHANSQELCDYYKVKFCQKSLSKPPLVLSLKVLSGMLLFGNKEKMPEDLDLLLRCLKK